MQRLPLSYLRPGMKTYEEVVDANGRVLCGKGVEITEELLRKFEEFGVQFVTVEGTPVNLPWERTLEEEIKALEERFKEVKDENLLKLKTILREFLEEKHRRS